MENEIIVARRTSKLINGGFSGNLEYFLIDEYLNGIYSTLMFHALIKLMGYWKVLNEMSILAL